MPKNKKEKNVKERIKKQLELVRQLKQKKHEERESLEVRFRGKEAKSKLSSRGEKHDKFSPGHHGNR